MTQNSSQIQFSLEQLCTEKSAAIDSTLAEFRAKKYGIDITSYTLGKNNITIHYQNPFNHPKEMIDFYLREMLNIPAPKKSSHTKLYQWLKILLIILIFLTTWILPKFLVLTLNLQLALGTITLGTIILCTLPLLKKAGAALPLMLIWLGLLGGLGLAVKCYFPLTTTWIITAYSCGALLLTGLLITAFRFPTNMYTAQFLALFLLITSGFVSLLMPQLILPMPHWSHMLLMTLALLLSTSIKSAKLKKIMPKIRPRWNMPFYVKNEHVTEELSVTQLAKQQKFSVATGSIIAINCHSTEPVWVRNIILNGEETGYQQIKAGTGLMPGWQIWRDNPESLSRFIRPARQRRRRLKKMKSNQCCQSKNCCASNSDRTKPIIPAHIPLVVDAPLTVQKNSYIKKKFDWIDRVTQLFTPLVMVFAIAAGVYAWATGLPILATVTSLLMCACPCVFCCITPLIELMASNWLACLNIEINPHKGGVLETLLTLASQKMQIVLDKTGTLTQGRDQHATTDRDRPPLRPAALTMIKFLFKRFGADNIDIVTGDWRLIKNNNEEPTTESLAAILKNVGKRQFLKFSDDRFDAEEAKAIFNFSKAARQDQSILQQVMQKLIYCPEKINWAKQKLTQPALWIADGINDSKVWLNDQLKNHQLITCCMPQSRDDVKDAAHILVHQQDKPLNSICEMLKIATKIKQIRFYLYAFAISYNLVIIPLAFLGYLTPLYACLLMCAPCLLMVSILHVVNVYAQPQEVTSTSPATTAECHFNVRKPSLKDCACCNPGPLVSHHQHYTLKTFF